MEETGDNPFVLDETEDFAVVYKPPRMHSAPLKNKGDTLLDWYAAVFPPVMEQGGLLHRLDFETQGLVLFAKNQQSLNFLSTQQDEGKFVKEYNAVCQKAVPADTSFPIPPFCFPLPEFSGQASLVIESFFRPFGPGRKQVRPLTESCGKSGKTARKEVAKDRGGYYRTEIVNVTEDNYYAFTVKLKRGFRHQIRCHLAWIGCPVLNDPLYGQDSAKDFLALRATGIVFTDPGSGKLREYRIAT